MEIGVIVSFCIILLFAISFGIPLVLTLLAGLCLFIGYAFYRRFSAVEILKMTLEGVKKASNILLTFIFIGMMTAIWRAAGTIPAIVTYCANSLKPQIIIIMSFLLCCLISLLTGTSLGSGATIGVICASVGLAMNISPVMLGGAILSGCYFGDRCSPVSTSMLLTAELTNTNPYKNIRRMFKTAIIPFILSCLFYFIIGFSSSYEGEIPDVSKIFISDFVITPIDMMPAIVIVVLSVLRVPVKTAMFTSIVSAIPICIFIQHIDLYSILQFIIAGFKTDNSDIAHLINGGGILSMVNCGAIVCISSAYSGIFEKTGLLNNIKKYIVIVASKINSFTAILITSIITSAASCNQTLSTILTYQLCSDLTKDNELLASQLEDTVIVIAPLIPWSIAGTIILNSAGLPVQGILFAVYLFLIPLYNLIVNIYLQKRNMENSGEKDWFL